MSDPARTSGNVSARLADECSLCGLPQGSREITVGQDGEPDEDGIVHWAHVDCQLDMDRAFADAFFGQSPKEILDYEGGDS